MSKIIEVNCTTGEVIERDPTPQEIEQRELDSIAAATAKAEADEAASALSALKASARAKLIAGQPLSAAEASVLVI